MKKTVFVLSLLLAVAALACSGEAPGGPEATGRSSQALTPSGDLVFTPGFVAPNWLPVGTTPLTPALAAVGLPETGIGYFSIGADTVNPAYFDRFNPNANTFLCFFGGYVLGDFPFASDWENPDGTQKTNMTVADVQNSANELVRIGNADQFAWLSVFPPAPFVSSLVPNSLVVLPAAPLFPAFNGWFLLSFEVSTVSELGADPAVVQSISPGLGSLYPPFSAFSSIVQPFEPYVAEALVLIKYDVAHHNFLAVYGNGVNWKSNDGHDHNTPVSTILQITSMMSQVTFQ